MEMVARSSVEKISIIRCDNGLCSVNEENLIGEEPLLIRVEGEPYAVIMRTPGEETFHAAGFCLDLRLWLWIWGGVSI